jgi:hypothetical protein
MYVAHPNAPERCHANVDGLGHGSKVQRGIHQVIRNLSTAMFGSVKPSARKEKSVGVLSQSANLRRLH